MLSAHHKSSCRVFYKVPAKTQRVCMKTWSGSATLAMLEKAEVRGERKFLSVK